MTELYPFLAYLKNVETGEVISVGVGDLVIAGIEPVNPPYVPMMFREYSKDTQRSVTKHNAVD